MADVGIVMPLYTQNPAFLSAAIQSVLNQTYRKFRFIIVVDGAPEMEPLVRAEIKGDNRVEVIHYPVNKGIAGALNTGFDPLLRDSSILYLTWVSSDNVYHPRYVEILRRTLAEGPSELGLVYSSFRSIDDNGQMVHSEAEQASQRQYQARPAEALLDLSIVGVSFMYKSVYARMTGGYGMQPVEDYDYWLRISEHCRIKHIPVELVDYRVNSAHSISASLQTPEEHRKWRYVFHLTRHQARMRRGIAPELTVLFPLIQALDGERSTLEDMYEQSYSNYNCIILDLSRDRQPSSVLTQISHPTSSFKWFPGVDVSQAILHAVQYVTTPYTIILGPSHFADPHDTSLLINYAKANETADTLSWYFPGSLRQIEQRRSSDTQTIKSDLFHELFRTEGLLTFISTIISARGGQ